MTRQLKWGRCRALAALALSATGAHATVVTSNATAPGDNFTNVTTVNQGQAVGGSGWYYNNVRTSGSTGINSTYARSGNGSVQLATTIGPGGASTSKADIEYLAGAINLGGNYYANQSLGLFSSLSEMHYDWYRNSASTNEVSQHPSLRVYLDADGNLATTGDRGYLIYENVYNGGATGVPVTTNAWVTANITSTTKLWSSNGIGFNGTDPNGGYAYDSSLAEWQAALSSAAILGFSSGVGSGWGPFSGAVDNIGWTVGGQRSDFNFEVNAVGAAVPEPASLALVGVALFGATVAGRRRR